MEQTANPPAAAINGLAQRVRAAFDEDPGAMTMQLAREFGVPEAYILRAMPEGRAVELDVSRWEELIGRFESLGDVHVIVTNGAATLECKGCFGGLSKWDPFFNVQTKTLDMHIRYGNLGAVFAVEKPSHMNGVNTLSIQFYDTAGAAAFKVFLNFGERVSAERQAQFTALRDEFRKAVP
jgi:putative heme utilization carrier protein HutX